MRQPGGVRGSLNQRRASAAQVLVGAKPEFGQDDDVGTIDS
jgi:hypothetical protein